MSASPRRGSRRPRPLEPAEAAALWQQMIDVRAQWQDLASSTLPADRPAAEDAIGALYAQVGRPRPRFVWVDSPAAGAAAAGPGASRALSDGPRSVDAELASSISDLRYRIHRRSGLDQIFPWTPSRVPNDPVSTLGTPGALRGLADPFVRRPLQRWAMEHVAALVRASLPQSQTFSWAGQFEVPWLAVAEVLRRFAGVRLGAVAEAEVERWAQVAGACGWWWPRDDVAVICERPTLLSTEAGERSGEMRLHGQDGPAIRYPDGWSVHVWHGTRVPAWVVEAPTPDRIAAEPNVEVRRCAIERLGWSAYLEQARLTPVAEADDPGNPGRRLELYDLPTQPWSRPSRLLLAVNGSVERDGTCRRYGLSVPAWFDDPLDAAGWSYGLTGLQYAGLRRRT